jgi:hypothetical protein
MNAAAILGGGTDAPMHCQVLDLTEVSEVEGDEDVVDLAGDVALRHRMISGLESPSWVRRST